MLDSDPDPHPDAKTPADHPLTDMERFFDTLFNQHMVLPQTPEGLAAGDLDPSHDNPGVTPV
jgi:hypothetical protein